MISAFFSNVQRDFSQEIYNYLELLGQPPETYAVWSVTDGSTERTVILIYWAHAQSV